MLLELLEPHPDYVEKVGPGVKEFYIGRTCDANGVFVGSNAIGIWIRRVDLSGERINELRDAQVVYLAPA